jgi:hypothetical protein
MKVDYIKNITVWKKINIKDKTYIEVCDGKRVPTFLAMERKLIKSLRD